MKLENGSDVNFAYENLDEITHTHTHIVLAFLVSIIYFIPPIFRERSYYALKRYRTRFSRFILFRFISHNFKLNRSLNNHLDFHFYAYEYVFAIFL